MGSLGTRLGDSDVLQAADGILDVLCESPRGYYAQRTGRLHGRPRADSGIGAI